MIKITQILIVLVSLNAIAQQNIETKVTYKEELNFDIPQKKITQLIYNNTQSIYTEKKITEVFDNSNNAIVKKYGNHFNKTVNVNLKKDSIFTKTSLNKKIFLIHEKVKKISWNIHKKKNDTILGFSVTKATGYFRGRIYTVWFSEEIPVKFGPWKLQGLPGLILEAKDNLNQVFFIAEKIEYIKKNHPAFSFSLEEGGYEKINLKKYNKILNEEIENKIQQIISKLPKGSRVINMKSKKYKGIELKYEWEKEE